ncbi:MAG: MAPEG family protein [Haliea sp.]|jgi:uncharacterized MAPEG superfamily protein|nr:MAPEG family protein [Haliea sp.]MBK6741344.1 MAPEG family protein [Haliea sp.]
MESTAAAILWLVMWWALLMVQLPLVRLLASRKTGSMAFDPNGFDLQGYGRRLTRAIANCQENIPIYIGVLLFAMVTDTTAITNATAIWLLYARIAQSVTHLLSTSSPMILLRFFFFLLQFLLIVWWVVQMLIR